MTYSLDFKVIANCALVLGLGNPSTPFLLKRKWPSPNNYPTIASFNLLVKGTIGTFLPINLPFLYRSKWIGRTLINPKLRK